MRRPLLLLLKAAISILLLYVSLRSVNLTALSERLSRLETGWLAAAIVSLAIQTVLVGARWRIIVEQCGVTFGAGAAVRISFIASFFNQVLPSTIGGDAVRVWLLGREGGGWANAAYSVLIDRIVGVVVLTLLMIAGLPWTLGLVHDPLARAFLLLVGLGAIAGTAVFMSIGALRWPLLTRWALTRHLVGVSRVAWQLCRSWHSMAPIGLMSVAIHLLSIAAAWCAAQSVAVPVGFFTLLFLMPPVILAATIPISIAGWGVREGSMIVAFAYAGLAQADGLIVSVLTGLATLAVGIIGGIVWIASDGRLRTLPPKAGVSPS